MSNKYTEGLKKSKDGRYILQEKIEVSNKTIVKKVITEKLTESINGIDLPVFSTYLIKLWSLTEKNKNGRNYRKVFNSVLEEKKVVLGLVDHPNDGEESYKNIVAVCKNPQMITDEKGEEWLAIELTLIGRPHGENAEACLVAGGFLEFSSSALGDVDYDGYVLLDGFFFERVDLVVNSSNAQLFFASKEEPRDISPKADNVLFDIKETITEVAKEIVKEAHNNTITEPLTIYTEDNKLSEKTGEKSMPDRISEKALELNIKSMIKDADSISDLPQRKELLNSALTYANELTEKVLSENIVSKIAETNKLIEELAEKGKSVDSLTESVKSLSETKDLLEKEVNTLKEAKTKLEEEHNTIVKLYEDKQFEASKKELDLNKDQSKKIGELTESISKITEERNYFEALANTKIDADKLVSLNEMIKKMSVDNAKLVEKVASLKESVRSYRTSRLSNSEKDIRTVEPTRQRESRISARKEFLNEEVETYYNILVEEDESLSDIKDKFAKCNTLKEARLLRMNSETHITERKKPSAKSEVSELEKLLGERGLV